MSDEATRETANLALQLVARFFDYARRKGSVLPLPILESPGSWLGTYDQSVLAVFYLNQAAQQRVDQFQSRGWPPFPGFVIGEAQAPSKAKAAFTVVGQRGFFASNDTSNLIAFIVGPRASFIVIDHLHGGRDSAGEEFRYTVDLAFILGVGQEEEWPEVRRRLSELLEYGLTVWSELR